MSEILKFNTYGNVGDETTITSSVTDSNLDSSTVSRGDGLTTSSTINTFGCRDWNIISLASAIANNDYIQFNVKPKTGYKFSLTSVYFNMRLATTETNRLTQICLRSSIDNYGSDLDEVKVLTTDQIQNVTFTFSQTNITGETTYRLYGANTNGSTGINNPIYSTSVSDYGLITNGSVVANISKRGTPLFIRRILTLANLTTDIPTNIESTSMTSGGNVISSEKNVSARGVCYSTTGIPTISDPHTHDGSGLGTFTSSLTGLTNNSTYNIRAYATSSAGIGYGETRTGRTESDWSEVTYFTDNNNLVYNVAMYPDASKILVAAESGLTTAHYISTNQGVSWTPTAITCITSTQGDQLSSKSGYFGAISDGRLNLYSNNVWSEDRPLGDMDVSWLSYSVKGGTTRLATNGTRVYNKTGATWTTSSFGFDKWKRCDINTNGTMAYAHRFDNGVIKGELYSLEIATKTLTKIKETPNTSTPFGCLATNDNAVVIVGEYPGRLYKSTNYGATWSELQPTGATDLYWTSANISENGSYIMVCALNNNSVFYSSDGGANWINNKPLGTTAIIDSDLSDTGSYRAVVADNKLYIWK